MLRNENVASHGLRPLATLRNVASLIVAALAVAALAVPGGRAAVIDVCSDATRCVHATLAAAAIYSGPGDTLRLLDAVYPAHSCLGDEPWAVVISHALTVRGHGATLELDASCPIGIAVASGNVVLDSLRLRRLELSALGAVQASAPTANVALVCGGRRRYAGYRPRDALEPVDVVPEGVFLDAREGSGSSVLDVLSGHAGDAANATQAQCVLSDIVLRRVDSTGATLADVLVLGRTTPLHVTLSIVESTLRSTHARHAIAATRTSQLHSLNVHESELADVRGVHVRLDGAVHAANMSYCYWGGAVPRIAVASAYSRTANAHGESPSAGIVITEPRYASAARVKHGGGEERGRAHNIVEPITLLGALTVVFIVACTIVWFVRERINGSGGSSSSIRSSSFQMSSAAPRERVWKW